MPPPPVIWLWVVFGFFSISSSTELRELVEEATWGPIAIQTGNVVLMGMVEEGENVHICGHFRGTLFPHRDSLPSLDISFFISEEFDRLFVLTLQRNGQGLSPKSVAIVGGDSLKIEVDASSNVNCLGIGMDDNGKVFIAGMYMVDHGNPLQYTSNSGGVKLKESSDLLAKGFFVASLSSANQAKNQIIGFTNFQFLDWPETQRRCIVSPVPLSAAPTQSPVLDSPSTLLAKGGKFRLIVRFTSCYSPDTPAYLATTGSISEGSIWDAQWTKVVQENKILVAADTEALAFSDPPNAQVELISWSGKSIRVFSHSPGRSVGVGLTPESVFFGISGKDRGNNLIIEKAPRVTTPFSSDNDQDNKSTCIAQINDAALKCFGIGPMGSLRVLFKTSVESYLRFYAVDIASPSLCSQNSNCLVLNHSSTGGFSSFKCGKIFQIGSEAVREDIMAILSIESSVIFLKFLAIRFVALLLEAAWVPLNLSPIPNQTIPSQNPEINDLLETHNMKVDQQTFSFSPTALWGLFSFVILILFVGVSKLGHYCQRSERRPLPHQLPSRFI